MCLGCLDLVFCAGLRVPSCVLLTDVAGFGFIWCVGAVGGFLGFLGCCGVGVIYLLGWISGLLGACDYGFGLSVSGFVGFWLCMCGFACGGLWFELVFPVV